ncbi:DUF192 domain-containing protein [Formicincola oecophyllae]|uniref:DUF192 domain-containing protein n=2 Tax=Formicincola oecophyllae TaxID=2558361 RepID=A0A4Y6UB44_9PROT|nr:DUF192 domain-containing protein [Formicincola oecophyllae]
MTDTGPADDTITAAQPVLPMAPLTITSSAPANRHGRTAAQMHHFKVELALTERQQEVGEMWRRSIPPQGGMLFIWKKPQHTAMWMRNTLVPLDILFIGRDRRIKGIEEKAVPMSQAIISNPGESMAVLELPAGTAARANLRVGDLVDCNALPPAQNPVPAGMELSGQ